MSATGSELRRGWPVVLAAGLGYGLTTIHAPTLGAMVKPVSAAFDWSRGEVTGAMMFLGFTGVLITPLVGRLVDRVGARKVALIALGPYVVLLAAIGLSGPALWTWYLTWGLMAVAYAAICPVVWTPPVVAQFDRQRGLALGLVLCGSGVCSTFAPALAVAATEAFGWRSAYPIMAAVVLAVVLPLTLLFFKDAPNETHADRAAVNAARGGMTLGAAFRTVRYWKLAIALVVTGGVAGALQMHMQPLFTDGGASPMQAAAMISVLGPSLILGRLCVGALLDRVPGPIVAAVAMGMPAVSMALLLGYDGTVWKGMLAAGLLGLAFGAEVDLLSYLGSRYFGLKNYGVIFGTIQGSITFGYAMAPMLVGFLFDRLGSYQSLLVTMIPVSLLMGAIIATLGRYPPAWDGEPVKH